MRALQEIFGRGVSPLGRGTPMRNRAFYVAGPNGRAFPMQIREGLALVVFGSKARGEAWIRETLPEPYKSQCRLGVWATLEQVEAWYRREGGRFDVVTPNPEPGAHGPGSYDRIGHVLEIARSEAGVSR